MTWMHYFHSSYQQQHLIPKPYWLQRVAASVAAFAGPLAHVCCLVCCAKVTNSSWPQMLIVYAYLRSVSDCFRWCCVAALACWLKLGTIMRNRFRQKSDHSSSHILHLVHTTLLQWVAGRLPFLLGISWHCFIMLMFTVLINMFYILYNIYRFGFVFSLPAAFDWLPLLVFIEALPAICWLLSPGVSFVESYVVQRVLHRNDQAAELWMYGQPNCTVGVW